MKKTNILVAAMTVLAAASVAKAGTPSVDFDGRLGAQTMHSIFSAGHSILPAQVSQQLAEPKASPAGLRTAYRLMSHKGRKAQIESLRRLNATLIKNVRLETLLNAEGTELWFYGEEICVLNSDLNARFTVRDARMTREVFSAGAQAKSGRTTGMEVVAGLLAQVATDIIEGVAEYGSWPPVPDSGMANYDPVTGNDYSPGWGE